LAKILVADHNKCTGCRDCELWCSFFHLKKFQPSLGFMTVVSTIEKGQYVPVICHHCKDPWCLNACPADAIERDQKTNAVKIIADKCTGCRACADACPFGVIKVTDAGDVLKCDLCSGDPECVKACTRLAVNYVEPAAAYTEKAVAAAGRIRGAQ